jgi:hypothetical protein
MVTTETRASDRRFSTAVHGTVIGHRPVAAVVAGLSVGLVAFSQIGGVFDGDEGLHLVAVQLVMRGERPFADFFYWHEPLYLYVAAGWQQLAGRGWRSAHVLSSLFTAGATAIVATIAARACASSPGGSSWGALAAVFFALNVLVLKWGTMAHNYAPTLLFMALAMAAALRADERRGTGAVATSGFCAGTATALTLLVAPLAPVLLLWIARRSPTSVRPATAAVFVLATLVPFAPLVALALQAPEQTWFALVLHHTSYRVQPLDPADVQWSLLVDALRSPQAWLLAGLSGVAVLRRNHLRSSDQARRRTVSLSGWLLIALAPFVTLIHPPVHAVYLVVVAPCVAILAAVGTSILVADIRNHTWRGLTTAGVAAVFVAGLMVSIYRDRLWVSEWARIERFAAEVVKVTPPDASFYTSFPFVYVAADHPPPNGLENGWASQMAVPDATFAMLDLASAASITDRVRRGDFDTVLLWRDDPRYPAEELDRLYASSAALDRYFVLRWERRR